MWLYLKTLIAIVMPWWHEIIKEQCWKLCQVAREALSWVKSKDWPAAVVEIDCLSAIQAIGCSSVNLSYLGRVIDECKQLIVDLDSPNVILKFVKRFANMVVHYIAIHSDFLADRSWE